jgi:hypothetical protein
MVPKKEKRKQKECSNQQSHLNREMREIRDMRKMCEMAQRARLAAPWRPENQVRQAD